MVEYFKIEEIPHHTYFCCERYRATLSVDACAKMWRAVHHDGDEKHMKCRVCPIGAVHAGETAASMSPFRGARICGRCHRVATRLIHRHLCVSCYNRQREWIVGKNAKGTMPRKLRRLHKRTIFYLHGDRPKFMTLDYSSSMAELMVAVLRDSSERVVFAFRGEPPINSAQLSLW